MYLPTAFAETNLNTLHDFIERHGFGMLVSSHGEAPLASHLPFLLDRSRGTQGTLWGHVARANPHWRELPERPVMAVFAGPHAYVSPTWYEAADTVPTWNYVAVHVYGRAETIEDEQGLLEILRRTTELHERPLSQPWSFDESDPYIRRLLAAVVGFRIEIERIEGKWKLNQNHPLERQAKVIAALEERGDIASRAVADLMRNRLETRPE